MAAEYENYRKRSTREADQKFNDGVSFAVNQIIPILDTLEIAANAPTTDENYKKGVTMCWTRPPRRWMPSMWRRSRRWESPLTPTS